MYRTLKVLNQLKVNPRRNYMHENCLDKRGHWPWQGKDRDWKTTYNIKQTKTFPGGTRVCHQKTCSGSLNIFSEFTWLIIKLRIWSFMSFAIIIAIHMKSQFSNVSTTTTDKQTQGRLCEICLSAGQTYTHRRRPKFYSHRTGEWLKTR